MGGSELVRPRFDRLHQAAGSEKVIDLRRPSILSAHACEQRTAWEELQNELVRLNAAWLALDAAAAPDGDAEPDRCEYRPGISQTL
jgi:hypothetical protein